MTGTKALFLDDYCRQRGRGYIRFDYFGHGASSGDVADGTIGRWADDAIAVIDSLTTGPQILVGSSMGGWIMLLAGRARPKRLHALVGIAAAPDFTEDSLWPRLNAAQREELARVERVTLPSEYDPAGYTFTRALIEDGRENLVLRSPLPIARPVRLLHGMRDASVPWRHSLAIAEHIDGDDVTVTLVKDGDHRLSRDADLALLGRTIDELSDD
jgi:pimeloyl-ACP methyl ester carboxylesterase